MQKVERKTVPRAVTVKSAEIPDVRPGGLVTVAFLKARLDESEDHLGIFMPLILDVLAQFPNESFTAQDIQEAVAQSHGVAMPQQIVTTLLKRAITKKYISRDMGRYVRIHSRELPTSQVAQQKAEVEEGQRRLGEALQIHANRRGLAIESAEAAIDMLFRFLEEEQIALLLGNPPSSGGIPDTSHKERVIIAEFVQHAVQGDSALLSVLRKMLEGLVLYHAAFLPDLSVASRRFKNLRVLFDSNLVRQALGYEGTAMRTLMRETIDVLKTSGVQCIVFDKTVHEIQRILTMYEARLATTQGRRSLRPVPMARHFLTQRYSPSDIREMSALLEREIEATGFQIFPSPRRIPEYTAGERALTARLVDPATKDELEPRVLHDVDCVAAVLTLRKSHRSLSIEDAGAIFATASPLVIRNVRLWWVEDENESGVEPVVHIRAISNLAWLKKPSLCADFKVRELVALCTAALRPDQATWTRFLRHLDSLHRSQRLNSDEVVAVLVSAMSDRLLRDAEFERDDPSDVDAVTLDEVVERVKATYAADAMAQIHEVEAKLAASEARERAATGHAEEVEHTAAERTRRHELLIEGRARTWAHLARSFAQWFLVVLVAAGAIALITGHPFQGGLIGITIGLAVVVFVLLEMVGILNHVANYGAILEGVLTRRFRNWLGGEPRD